MRRTQERASSIGCVAYTCARVWFANRAAFISFLRRILEFHHLLSPTPLHACADPSSPPTRSGYRPSDAVAFLAIEPRLRIESMILLILDAVLDDATVRLLSAALKREKANSVANIVATS